MQKITGIDSNAQTIQFQTTVVNTVDTSHEDMIVSIKAVHIEVPQHGNLQGSDSTVNVGLN